jgi:serine/threonine-protein kinase
MSDARADRNLLFGILALQMDFIDRDALVAAMNAWVLEKSKPLGQVLVSQGKLRADEHDLLDALVQKHLQRHSNDPQQSLAAVSSVGSVKDELERLADPDLGQSLQHIAAARPHDPYATAMPSVGTETSLGQRFRILRPHAKGGLGQVSVAHDAELHREVALKEIQPRHADDSQSRTRFLVEAEITGGLEHPGIVPVYGLGTYGDGRPYYAMRFIRGDSLKDAIERFHRTKANRDAGEVSLELRQLLGRLIDVANAIEYAHCRGVLHRDLKPGNIMLGKYGETLVVDWGLAKAMDQPESVRLTGEASLKPSSASGTAPTLLGSAVGTPQYMSPEQAAGRHDQAGPASDVYSLGATMYALLTGRAPFEDGDIGQVLKHVQQGDFTRPREVDKQVPPALEAICLKAMAREPRDRYGSPLAMANDLEHWLADEPVTSYRDSAAERASRWLRRHRSWALAGAAALVVISTVSVAATLIVNEARQQEIAARQQEETARKEAQRQRLLAEQSFQQARRAVDDFFTRVAENDLLDAPGLQPLRRELLDVALRYDQEFIKARGDDPALRRELASAWFRLAMITSEIESHVKSLDMLEKARAIQEELLAKLPGDAELRLAASNTHNELGRLMFLAARPDEALKAFQQALSLREKLAGEKPDQEEYQRRLASSLMNVALVRKQQGQLDEALEELKRANAVRQTLLDRNPQSPRLKRDLARGHYNLGLMQQEAGRSADAQQSLEQAVELYRRLAEEQPLVIEYRQALARALRQLGLLQDEQNRAKDAGETLRQALDVQQRLATENPSVGHLAADLAAICSDLSQLERRRGQSAEARRYIAQADQVLLPLVKANPTVVSYASDLAAIELIEAELLLDDDDPDKAQPLVERARDRYEQLRQSQPDHAGITAGLATSWAQLGLIQRRKEAPDEARTCYDKAAALFGQLADNQPDNSPAQDGLARCYANLGMIDQSQDRLPEALAWFEKARDIHQRFAEPAAGRWNHIEHLAETLTLIGSLQTRLERPVEAAEAFANAKSLAAELLRRFPDNAQFDKLHKAAQAGKTAASPMN